MAPNMICPKCKNKAISEAGYRFCPFCGEPLSAEDPSPISSVSSDGATPQLKAAVKKPMPFWFKLASLLAVLSLIGVTAGILFTESWVDVVDHHLEALRRHDSAKAYEAYTSKDFQAATPLEHFRNFIEVYPVFLNNQSAHFSQRTIEHHIRILKGNLTSSDRVNTPIEYKLIKEDGKWKILSIRLLKPENIPSASEAHNGEDLIDVVKGQLKDVQDRKLGEAYQLYSSSEFKDATSEDAFFKFLQRYPLLTHFRAASFHNPSIRNGLGALSVILQSGKNAANIKYYLVYEDQQWRVWSMRVLSVSEDPESMKGSPSEPLSLEKPMHFEKILLGDKVDKLGAIEQPASSFKHDLGDLFVDIEIKDGLKGEMIYLNLKSLDSGLTISAKAPIEADGETQLLSVFTPPSGGWPKGHYELTANSSSGLEKSVDFSIE